MEENEEIHPMPSQRFFDMVARELRDSRPLPGLWARAFSDAMGDMNRARALYIRYRADELAEIDERQQCQTREQNTRTKKDRDERQAAFRSLQRKVVWMRFALSVFLVFGLFLMIAAGIGIIAAIGSPDRSILLVSGFFGALGLLAFQSARKGLDALND